jgi:IPT/TIG domain
VRRRPAHPIWGLIRAAGVAALVVTWALLAAGAAAAATTTTLGFDDLAPGTVVSNQYDAQGVDFQSGIIGINVYCHPVITAVAAGQAQSGNQVADASCANGEFPDSSIYGILSDSAQHVSVYAGFTPTFSSPPASAAVTLDGYDVLGNIVATSTVAVPTDAGTHTLISVASSSPNIVAFDVTSNAPSVSVDDLTFDNPGGVPADFAINVASGSSGVVQGSQVTDTIAIQRFNGSNGGVTFTASGLPAGVHASFSPNPATGNTTTLTLSADPTAPPSPPGPFPSFTVTGTPTSAAVGPAARSVTPQIAVNPLFTINAPPSIAVPPCSTLQVPVTVTGAAGFTGPVSLTATGLPSDDTVSFAPSTLTLPGQTKTVMTLTSQSDINGPPGNLIVTATGGGAADASGAIHVTRVGPSITTVTNPSAQPLSSGVTPQGVSPDEGTVVIIRGQGFCPGSTVYFGNDHAAATTQGPFTDGLGPFGDETAIRTAVPSLATSGDVFVVRQGESLVSSGTATAPFSIDNYRNVNGFSFDNSDQFQSRVGGYSFSDVSDVFGDEQTHISVNPCWPFGDCSITTPVPDPFALLFWGVADAALQDGQCFGFSLASQRLLHGDQIFPAFPRQAGTSQETVWNLQGPESSGGASDQLAHYIHLMHMEQFSREALSFWLAKSTTNAVSGSQSSLLNDVTSALDAGDHPLVELRNGTEGHVVVAYGVDQANGSSIVGPGDRVIDVYNPNAPFTAAENSTDGTTHETTLSTSEIVVHPNGHWEFQGFSPEYHGGPGSLVVMPYGVVPVHPDLPIDVSGLISLMFGSATATQVTDGAGHTLLNPDGSINTSHGGIADATQFATLSGTAKPGPDIFLFGHSGGYSTTVQGNGSGQYHDAMFFNGTAASLTAAASSKVRDQISVPAGVSGLQFGQTSAGSGGPRAATVQLVVHGAQQSRRTATIATTVPTSGQTGTMFDASHDAVVVTAGGQPTSYTLSLSWAGPHGLPQTFVAPAVRLAAGDQATFAPDNWSTLQSGKVTLRIKHRNGRTSTSTLRNRTTASARYSVALKIAKAGKTRRRLTIRTQFQHLTRGSSALLTWEVLKGRHLVAHHVLTVTAAKLHRGPLTRTVSFKGSGSTHYALRAGVSVLSPAHDGTYTSRLVTRVERFRG